MQLPEVLQKQVDEVRRRHPERVTAGGALLAEMRSTEDFEYQVKLGWLVGVVNYKRGFRHLEAIVNVLLKREITWVSETRKQISLLLCAIGRLDSPASHKFLARVLRESDNQFVRADVLEGMAFEDKQFELELVLPFTSPETNIHELLSALYALTHKYSSRFPRAAKKRLLPLFKHEDPYVRLYAVQALTWHPQGKKLIAALKGDPDKHVRDEVNWALENYF